MNQAGASEVLNAANIMDNPNLTDAEKKEEILKSITRITNELIEAKAKLKKVKESGTMNVQLDIE